MLYQPWRMTLFGTLAASTDVCRIERFRTKQAGLLLAFLAYFPERPHTREELADRLWPDSAPEQARANLRVALSSLRRQMEPPGVLTGSVLDADRTCLRLRPGSFTTDTAAFQAAVRCPSVGESQAARAARLGEAAALYTGELLLGFYDDWVIEARESLEGCLRRTLKKLIEDSEALGDDESVLNAALRLNAADPLDEKSTLALMRRAIRRGQPAEARREFERLEQRLKTEIDAPPSAEARALRDLARAPSVIPVCPPCAPIISLPTPEALEKPPLRILPLMWTRFFGRETESAALCKLLADPDVRLVTITGPGGAGKTRLAAETAKQLAGSFPGPVCFVPLADIRSAGLLLDTIASSLRLPTADTAGPLDRIAEALSNTPALVVLDNLEQIASSAGPVVQSLLARLPELRCLAVSRRPLHLPGERAFPLGPLSTPPTGEVYEKLPDYPSVQLFTDRAQAVRPDFQITQRNAAAVGALCTRLEGLPLALELAASWIGVLTPAQALGRLDERFALLVSRSPETIKRHRTLHAAIAWSFDLLPADLREFWAKLSVFRGGWTAEAAEAVCGHANALEALERLRERSLILAEEAGEAMRFRMLESLREFAAEQLSAASDTQERHARYFLEFAEAAQPRFTGSAAKDTLRAAHTERANLLAALDWDDGPTQDPALGLRTAAALWRFWAIRGPFAEGERCLARALARIPAEALPSSAAAHAWNGLAGLIRLQGRLTEACEHNTLALAHWRALNDDTGIARTLNNLAGALMQQGECETPEPLLEESLALWRGLGSTRNIAGTLQNLSYLALQRGDDDALSVFSAESLTLFGSLGDEEGIAHVHSTLAEAALKRGDVESAAQWEAGSLRHSLEVEYYPGVFHSLNVLIRAACGRGEAQRPALVLGAVEHLKTSVEAKRNAAEEAQIALARAALRDRLGDAGLADALRNGAVLSWAQAAALALESVSLPRESENPQSVQ